MASLSFSTPDGVSKKLVVLLVSTALLAMNQKFNLGITPDVQNKIVALAGAYILGQGVADFGKGKTQAEAKLNNGKPPATPA